MLSLSVPRHAIERLGPYPSLLLIAVPLAIVEPLKLLLVVLAGNGHFITAAIAVICAYAVSLFVTHRLFGIVKPKLLTLPWFATCWNWFVVARTQLFKRCVHSRVFVSARRTVCSPCSSPDN
jgi:hypothetical protein